MKYLTFFWSVCFAGVAYLPLMLTVWIVTGSFPPWWVAFILISVIAFVVHFIILLRKDYEWKSEDVYRPDEVMQADVDDMKKRREEAEKYILESGDEEAIQVLQQARANFYCYNSILLNGTKKGNDTLKIALAILSGLFEGKEPAEIRNGDVAEAIKKMESMFIPTNAKKSEMEIKGWPGNRC